MPTASSKTANASDGRSEQQRWLLEPTSLGDAARCRTPCIVQEPALILLEQFSKFLDLASVTHESLKILCCLILKAHAFYAFFGFGIKKEGREKEEEKKKEEGGEGEGKSSSSSSWILTERFKLECFPCGLDPTNCLSARRCKYKVSARHEHPNLVTHTFDLFAISLGASFFGPFPTADAAGYSGSPLQHREQGAPRMRLAGGWGTVYILLPSPRRQENVMLCFTALALDRKHLPSRPAGKGNEQKGIIWKGAGNDQRFQAQKFPGRPAGASHNTREQSRGFRPAQHFFPLVFPPVRNDLRSRAARRPLADNVYQMPQRRRISNLASGSLDTPAEKPSAQGHGWEFGVWLLPREIRTGERASAKRSVDPSAQPSTSGYLVNPCNTQGNGKRHLRDAQARAGQALEELGYRHLHLLLQGADSSPNQLMQPEGFMLPSFPLCFAVWKIINSLQLLGHPISPLAPLICRSSYQCPRPLHWSQAVNPVLTSARWPDPLLLSQEPTPLTLCTCRWKAEALPDPGDLNQITDERKSQVSSPPVSSSTSALTGTLKGPQKDSEPPSLPPADVWMVSTNISPEGEGSRALPIPGCCWRKLLLAALVWRKSEVSLLSYIILECGGTSWLPLTLDLSGGNKKGLDKRPYSMFLLILEVRDWLQQEGMRGVEGKLLHAGPSSLLSGWVTSLVLRLKTEMITRWDLVVSKAMDVQELCEKQDAYVLTQQAFNEPAWLHHSRD
ncbi:hypothetical protein Anapl_14352 [Anas platyrhynchos]|uniref:Uncharacterized protein n=1 Tax=Anas platyrhynchos TaxID=8839 RepID=R0J8E7_ANAPL|nr:hypothetical protein Anapl_14352 [Anas platyrhynchos]